MQDIPCRNCITLPICKSRVHTYKDIYSLKAFMEIKDRCSLLKKYFDSSKENHRSGGKELHYKVMNFIDYFSMEMNKND